MSQSRYDASGKLRQDLNTHLAGKEIGGVHDTNSIMSNIGTKSYISYDSNYRTTDYAVNPNTKYRIRTSAKGGGAGLVAFFNGATFLSYKTTLSTTLTDYDLVINTPSNCTRMVVNSYYPTDCVVTAEGESNGCYCAGKTFLTIGDSRTWYDQQTFGANTSEEGIVCNGYQYYLRNVLGINTLNFGQSGYTTPQISNLVTRGDRAYLYDGFDYCFLDGGVNDWLQGVAIGTLQPIGSAFDVATVTGALQAMIEKFLANKKMRIYMTTPFMGWNNGDSYTEEYTQARFAVANLYGIPILDLTHDSRLNALNKDLYYTDVNTTYQLHLTNGGYEFISNQICEFIKTN